jgi:hypothetical protein
MQTLEQRCLLRLRPTTPMLSRTAVRYDGASWKSISVQVGAKRATSANEKEQGSFWLAPRCRRRAELTVLS